MMATEPHMERNDEIALSAIKAFELVTCSGILVARKVAFSVAMLKVYLLFLQRLAKNSARLQNL